MRRHGLTPDMISFCAGVRACCRAGQRGVALELLSEAEFTGVVLNYSVYKAVLEAFGRAGDEAEVVKLRASVAPSKQVKLVSVQARKTKPAKTKTLKLF